MIDGQQLPKKISTQNYRIKNRINDKSKHLASIQNNKSPKVSVDIQNKKQILNKIKNNQKGVKKKSSDRTIRYMPEIKSFANKKTVQKLPKHTKFLHSQGVQMSIQTQNINKNSAADFIAGLKNQGKKELEDYEQEFLLKWKAKEFVNKLKKDKQEAQKTIDIMRLEAQQKKQAKLLQLEKKARIQQQNQLKKRRQQAKHKIQEVKFKQERRKEEFFIRDLYQKKLQKSNRSSSIFNYQAQQKINELNAILHRRAKTRVETDNLKTKQISPVNRIASSQSNVKQNKNSKSIYMPKNLNCKSTQLPKTTDRIEKHLYLSIDDEKMLQDIKIKLQKLQSLRPQAISKSIKKNKQRFH